MFYRREQIRRAETRELMAQWSSARSTGARWSGARLCFLPLIALVISGMGGCTGSANEPLEIRFVAEVGDAPAQCGTRYSGVGALGGETELADARLYVSNFMLHRADGTQVPVELEQDSPWQHGGVTLLDFEDATGRCSDSGTEQTNGSVRGSVPAGDYSGLSFEVGVPWELNHLDALTAPSPLNLNAMYWNWRLGYIFTKIEFWNVVSSGGVDSVGGAGGGAVDANPADKETTEPSEPEVPAVPTAPTVTYLAHVGSTGCESPAPTTPPTEACSRPNRARIFLQGFNPKTDAVRLDLAGLVDGIDITRSVLRPPGCMAAPTDPDCVPVFANLGLDLATGRCFTDCSDQKLASSRSSGGGE